MKKIMMAILVSFMLFAVPQSAKSQVSFSHTSSNPTGTVTNAGSDTMTYTLTRGYSLIAFQPNITKTSGTLAGKCYLEYSVYGTSTTWILNDSLTLTNVSNSTGTFIKAIPARYWRIRTVGSGTMVATTDAKLSTN